jgi:hypothetical protein
VRFEVFTALRMMMLIFRAKDEDSVFQQNVAIYVRAKTQNIIITGEII